MLVTIHVSVNSGVMLLSHSAEYSSGKLASCSHLPARTSHLGRPVPRRLRQPSHARPCAVLVHFKEEDIVIEAEPKDNLIQVTVNFYMRMKLKWPHVYSDAANWLGTFCGRSLKEPVWSSIQAATLALAACVR